MVERPMNQASHGKAKPTPIETVSQGKARRGRREDARTGRRAPARAGEGDVEGAPDRERAEVMAVVPDADTVRTLSATRPVNPRHDSALGATRTRDPRI